MFTLIFPVSPVLLKVHDDLKGWISLARSPRSIKELNVLLILLHGDPRGLPVLLHVDWLQGVTGGEVVPSYHPLCRPETTDTSYLRTGSPRLPPTANKREKKTTSIMMSPLWLPGVTTPIDTVLLEKKINQ